MTIHNFLFDVVNLTKVNSVRLVQLGRPHRDLKFDTATWAFLKIDMRHRPYSDMRRKIRDTT